MAISNFPEGFLGFQAEIEALTESLGGHQTVRIVVASQFADDLKDVVKHRLFGDSYGYPSDRLWVMWTEATDQDFKTASTNANRYFAKRVNVAEPTQEWDSVTFNAKIVLRESDLYLERADHVVFLACGRADDYAKGRLHPAQTERRDPWTVSLMKHGETIVKAINKRPDKSRVTVQGLSGAQRSLIRFAELFV